MKKRCVLLGICLFLHSTPAATQACTLFRTLATTCAAWALLGYQVGAEDDNTPHTDQQQLTNETIWYILSRGLENEYGTSIEVKDDGWMVNPNGGTLGYAPVVFKIDENGNLVQVEIDSSRYDDDISNEKALCIWQP